MADVVSPERTLPHNLEAERSVLGAILLHNDAFNLAAEVIDSKDFFRDAHRRIFDKMVKLSERGDAIDLVTLKDELGRSGEIDEVGGPAYIAALVDGVPRSTNVEHYARIVKEKATLRNLIFSANKILATAYEGEEEAEIILDQAEHAIFAIADEKVRDGFVSLRDLAQSSFETIERLHAHKELVTGVPTGFTDLDEITSGLQPSDLVIVAARPSVGKTSLVLNIAQHVGTRTDLCVGIFSLEMSKEQLFLRMLTAEARIDAHRLRGGFLGERDWGKLSQAIGTLSEAKIFVDDTPAIGVLEMRAKCRRLAAEHGLNLVIVDYIQLMQGRGRFENRTLELASISRSLKGLAKELNVPVVVLSQLSRAPESRSDHRPQLSDLRECVTGDTLVVLADGRRAPVRDLVGMRPSVWAMSPGGAIERAAAEMVWPAGTRQVLAVRLASGRVIRTTIDHRLFASTGWQRAGELSIGDRVALAGHIPDTVEPEPWPERRVALLGHLIGGGSYRHHQPVRYTTRSSDNSSLVARAAEEEFGCSVTRHDVSPGSWHQLVISGNGDRRDPDGLHAWLAHLGILGQRSFEKRVPVNAFRLPAAQVAILLRHVWAAHGAIARRRGQGGHAVYYATASEGLAFDVSALLLRLGIVASVGTAATEARRRGFRVRVCGSPNQRAFLRLVGAHGPRAAMAQSLANELAGVEPSATVHAAANGPLSAVRRVMQAQGGSSRQAAALLEPADATDGHDPGSSVTSDLVWDRVIAIDPGAEEEVFDLTVPGAACWLADGIVSHNSGALEQDADVVIFIYREDLYVDKTRPPTDNQGVAELIVGKQRNGPTGVVKLAFIREYTRFENLAMGAP